MNYLKVIRADYNAFEEVANAFLRELNEKGHRIINTKYYHDYDETTGYFHCDDEPRKPYQRHKSPASTRTSEI